MDLLDNKFLDSINDGFTSAKTHISDIWNGGAAQCFNSAFDSVINSIDKIYEAIDNFNTVLDKLAIYKQNQNQIENLQAQIAEEMQNPSIKQTNSYMENGVLKTSVVYVVDQNLIDSLQLQIDKLLKENEILKTEMQVLCNLVSSEELSNLTQSNLKPKNNSDIAHRGYNPGGIRENSIEAFRLAGEKGFWGCETDVRFDSNGNLICSHNTPQGNENPPTFEEYLDICKEYGMTAIIDLKYENGFKWNSYDSELSPAIIKTIEEKGMMDSCVIQTNYFNDIPFIRSQSDDVRIWLLGHNTVTDENIELALENNVECINFNNTENNAYRIKKVTDAGIDACVWNVQTEQGKNILLNDGAKYIMSDNVLGITPYQEGEEDFNNL